MDYRATVINCLTAGYPEGASLPVYFDSDHEAVDAALAINGTRPAPEARVMHIRNTLRLEELEISEACLQEKPITEFQPVGASRHWQWDAEGNLPAVG
jgi:hypothetical protein